MNKTVILKSRPLGMLSETNFEVVERPIPEPAAGELLVKNYFASLDPGVRKLLGEPEGYMVPTALGEVLRTNTVGRVLQSRHPDYADVVYGAPPSRVTD